jgi:adenylosuccinate synthase
MIEYADVVVGLAWGDEAKGKITSHLGAYGEYDMVARWAGGNNAGHTVFVDGKKYKTHLIPSGVFHGITSVIGPGCVLHPESFFGELEYLKSHGFDTSLVKVSPKAHIVQAKHIEFDKANLAGKLGTTSRGIAPVYADKHARTGILAEQYLSQEFLWDNTLDGRILCEGAQGFWLDIDHGNYPFVTSSVTLPYGACSLGFPPQKIRNIWGAAKIYDTRSGEDPLFPASLLDDPLLLKVANAGQEYGVTTGRRRKVRWLDLDLLIHSINMTGTTNLVISKCDVLEEVGEFALYIGEELETYGSMFEMQGRISSLIASCCPLVKEVTYSYSPEKI